MQLHNLPKIIRRKAKRVGRGPGSGKGKTSGRGMKGQKARSKIKRGFEGGQLKFAKRLPFLRGHGNTSHKPKPLTIDISQLNSLRSGSKVTPEMLVEKGIIKKIPSAGIKILAKNKLEKKLILEGLRLTAGAKRQVEERGGKVE
ncbi:50S ribosomal protein L15 [Patescibacteria group bacterium]|nr:50S ribosomal protein L15 [Patescibacteria group bacterium]MBU1867868.1 50S ribosomal protein L15 [Patescibacteria group bacterium]